MKYATGKRLEEIAEEFFEGNRSELARNIEMKPQALSKYLKGESMPGGLILIRLHDIGVNINWFLTGEGKMKRDRNIRTVAEPIKDYLTQLEEDILKGEDKRKLNELMDFSGAIRDLEISPSLQRALLLVYARHMVEEESREK